jgi:hypothetical protein
MLRRLALALAICLFFAGSAAIDAKGAGSRGSKGTTSSGQKAGSGKTVRRKAPAKKTTATTHKSSTAARESKRQSSVHASGGVARDERGRIQRSGASRHAFARQTGYSNGRPGYVIDHIVPLACGGADDPSNMQWQTIAEAKAKDKTERAGCR